MGNAETPKPRGQVFRAPIMHPVEDLCKDCKATLSPDATEGQCVGEKIALNMAGMAPRRASWEEATAFTRQAKVVYKEVKGCRIVDSVPLPKYQVSPRRGR